MKRRTLRRIPLRFVFTQLSAPVVGCTMAILSCEILKKTEILTLSTDMTSLQTLLFVVLLLAALIMYMILWGRVLVVLGALSKEEAQGYPYSRPWEKSELEEKGLRPPDQTL